MKRKEDSEKSKVVGICMTPDVRAYVMSLPDGKRSEWVCRAIRAYQRSRIAKKRE